MRLALFILAVAVIAASAATFKPVFTNDVMLYSNGKSLEFARGDGTVARGWRECEEAENTGSTFGIMCEGTRTIEIPPAQLVDVNYFCEFVFSRRDANSYRVEYQICQ